MGKEDEVSWMLKMMRENLNIEQYISTLKNVVPYFRQRNGFQTGEQGL